VVAVSDSSPGKAFAVLLGTAQDGGIPHIGCRCETCDSARGNAEVRRHPSSLLIVNSDPVVRVLIDATPALPEQLDLANRLASPARASGPCAAPFDGIFITHVHFGHYTGLMYLGAEALAVREQTVYATGRVCSFLRTNAPWELLVRAEHIRTIAVDYDRPVELAKGLSIVPIAVPHRAEYADTCAFVVYGPRRALLYAPDTDRWDDWRPSVEERIAAVDIALLDGTFFDANELPGRTMSDVPHPCISDTIAKFAALPLRERSKVHFTHLNHTNPALMPSSPAELLVLEAGMQIARERQVFML
jgi:pyrroloquinoline quinone biosynthesis protein B